MTREEVQKVIDEGGYMYLHNDNPLWCWLFKPRYINGIFAMGLSQYGDGFSRENDHVVVGIGNSHPWRVATQEEINQYVNGTDKQP